VLDQYGRLVWVNRAWRKFAKTKSLKVNHYSVGTEYVALMAHLMPPLAANSGAENLLELLHGRRSHSRIEFPAEGNDFGLDCRLSASQFEHSGSTYLLLEHDTKGDLSRGAFEDLLARLSSSLIRAEVSRIDAEIASWVARVATAFDLDRSTVLRLNPDDGGLYIIKQYAREGVVRLPDGLKIDALMPWSTAQLKRGDMVVISSREDVPPEAAEDLRLGEQIGFGSRIFIPLKVRGLTLGAMGFASIATQRVWSPTAIQRLSIIAELFGSALERQFNVSEISRLRSEMREISRVASMGELTASLAHELNQPLGSILNNAQAAQQLLRKRKPDLREVRAALQSIVDDHGRAAETVRSVRALFQKGGTQLEQIDLTTALRDAERLVRGEAAARKIEFRLDLPSNSILVRGHAPQLIELTVNLILNAFDSISECTDDLREVTLSANCNVRSVCVRVHDSGTGIDPMIIGRMFKPFTTTKRNGMGMGLAIARSIVDAHGGTLDAEQNPERGATVKFILPLNQGVE
jgi:signal transduction histidine kinase